MHALVKNHVQPDQKCLFPSAFLYWGASADMIWTEPFKAVEAWRNCILSRIGCDKTHLTTHCGRAREDCILRLSESGAGSQQGAVDWISRKDQWLDDYTIQTWINICFLLPLSILSKWIWRTIYRSREVELVSWIRTLGNNVFRFTSHMGKGITASQSCYW